jgi:hypothetical protein
MNRVDGMYRGEETYIQNLALKLKTAKLENPEVDGRIKLKWIFDI